jgi:hypothetical protein
VPNLPIKEELTMTPQYPCVYKRDGRYAKHSSIPTHIGNKNIVAWTDDLQEATVFPITPTQLMLTNLLDGAEPIPVSEHRTVTILPVPTNLQIHITVHTSAGSYTSGRMDTTPENMGEIQQSIEDAVEDGTGFILSQPTGYIVLAPKLVKSAVFKVEIFK